jgi:glycosyltransferase involved in cell wall biosynthesis
MKSYDTVFVTHLPAFYKVNLYNEIAKRQRVFVIFIAATSVIRAKDFTPADFGFDYTILNKGPFESRSKRKSLFSLFQLLKNIRFRQIIVGGWDLIEFWMVAWCFPKKSNALACESSIYESKTKTPTGWLKRLFLSRMQCVYCSGHPQQALIEALAFKGEMKKTLGVGIFNYSAKTTSTRSFEGKCLYVGRLSPEKNLEALVALFATLPSYHLTLIGQGPLQAKLQAILPSNVSLVGHVPNESLATWYQSHDIFILPSLREPWGLVVEEALYYGLPVIASEHVGSASDLITSYRAGALFSPCDPQSFKAALNLCVQNYTQFKENVQKIDFKVRDQNQVSQYQEGLPEV